jgi:hypothetical protein
MKTAQMGRGHGQTEPLMTEQAQAGEASAKSESSSAFKGPGQFGRMFELPAFRPPDDALIALGTSMEDINVGGGGQEDPAGDNPHVPAGFTYLGQFVDHDITFDRTVGFPVIDDPAEIEQARTPKLELDSVYGMGPVRQPDLYEPGLPPGQARFRIGKTSAEPSANNNMGGMVPVSLPHDLPRAPIQAVIADPRNDENLVVAQTHLAFLQFHNKVMDMPPGHGHHHGMPATPGTPFEQARRIVRWHYQWIVLNDWVRRIVIPEVLDEVLRCGRMFYRFEDTPGRRPYMPLEFSVAAYRLGHSMIRQVYDYNRVFSHDPNAITPATLQLLFLFTGNQRPGQGRAPIPSNWIIDWRRFFPVEPNAKVALNQARRLDTRLANPLRNLPEFANIAGDVPSLAQRNLLRGSRVGLPTGQEVARAMKLRPLSPESLASGAAGGVVRQHGFHENTPLWYYILKEAEVQQEGVRLGEVGSRIVSEVFVGMLQGDKTSFLHAHHWQPTLPAAKPGTFTMADLLRFVGNINPIGD